MMFSAGSTAEDIRDLMRIAGQRSGDLRNQTSRARLPEISVCAGTRISVETCRPLA
jgi:hypothetical protein